MGDRACRARSSDLGVKTISGRGARHRDLGAQEMEVLGRGGRLGDPHVAPGAQGEEPLDAGRGVLGALALVAVGQQQDQAGLLAPLVLGGHQEVVDDDLGAVPEVAELGLPGHQIVDGLDRVAVLEAHAGVLGQQRVADGEPAALRGRPAARTPPRWCGRPARRGAGRTSPAGCPGRSAGRWSPPTAASRRPAPRPAPSRSRRRPPPCPAARTGGPAWGG